MMYVYSFLITNALLIDKQHVYNIHSNQKKTIAKAFGILSTWFLIRAKFMKN